MIDHGRRVEFWFHVDKNRVVGVKKDNIKPVQQRTTSRDLFLFAFGWTSVEAVGQHAELFASWLKI